MQYRRVTDSYNEKRYGAPWLGVVTDHLREGFTFIDWQGDKWKGTKGEFVFDAQPGTVYAYGQKDHRKGRGGVDGYLLAMPNGQLANVPDHLHVVMFVRATPAKRIQLVADHWFEHFSKSETVYTGQGPRKVIQYAKLDKWAKICGRDNPVAVAVCELFGLRTPTPAAAPVIDLSGAFGV